MKKLFTLLTLVVLGMTTFTACSKDDENTGIIEEEEAFVGDGSITMVAEDDYVSFYIDTFNEGDTVTIDWGDGKVETLKSVKQEGGSKVFYEIYVKHEYSTKKQYTVKIASDMKIQSLSCGGNQLTSLDVSQCTSLEGLSCWPNQLTTLDVSKNVELEWLYCYSNKLTSLDVSKNVKLSRLECYNNKLTSLDVSKNLKLEELSCDGNQLTSLDVSKNLKLEELKCYKNQLTTLDVSKNVNLESLVCDMNQLTSLDLSKNVKLRSLYCYSNKFTASAMNQIYNALPDLSGKDEGYINISQPYGDYSIAEGKNWQVNRR